MKMVTRVMFLPTMGSCSAAGLSIQRPTAVRPDYTPGWRRKPFHGLLKWLRDIPRRLQFEKHAVWVCVDYYLVDLSDYPGPPPGDNYFHWGWQDDPDEDEDTAGSKPSPHHKIPPDVVEKFEEFAHRRSTHELIIGRWKIADWNE